MANYEKSKEADAKYNLQPHIINAIKRKLGPYIYGLFIFVAIANMAWMFFYSMKSNQIHDRIELEFCADASGSNFNCWNCDMDLSRSKTLICQTCGWNICAGCGACTDPRFGGCDAYSLRTSGKSNALADIKWRKMREEIVETINMPSFNSLIIINVVVILIYLATVACEIETELEKKGIIPKRE